MRRLLTPTVLGDNGPPWRGQTTGTGLAMACACCVLLAGGLYLAGDAQAATPAGQAQSLDVFKMAMAGLAGLVLFFDGLNRLANGLANANSERIRALLARFTTNHYAGVGTGIVATTLLESSSVTIIMVIAMVSSGLMTFVQSLGVVLGANIGTAVGAQIITLNIYRYVPLLMFAGLLLSLAARHDKARNAGVILLGFGLLFFGLELLAEAVRPLRDHQPFMDMVKTLGDRPLLAALLGALLTVILQSSSATVAIVIVLAGGGMMTLPAGVAIMLGTEIGTCFDTLVATVGRGRPALRTGAFHLAFNVASVSLGLLLAPQLIELALAVSGEAGVDRQIANAQILFNLIGVAIVTPFLPAIAEGLRRLIPDPPPAPAANPPVP